jgi:hypothetical protein
LQKIAYAKASTGKIIKRHQPSNSGRENRVMKDRFLNGFIAGIIGGIVGVTGGLISKALGITEMTAVDFTAMLLYGREILMTSEFIWATIAGIMFTGVFGIIFAHMILLIKSRYLFIKGAVYGFVAWYVWYSLILNTFTEQIDVITISTSISNAVNAMLYGIVLSISYNFLHQKAPDVTKAREKRSLENTKKYRVVRREPKHHKLSFFKRFANVFSRKNKV